MSLNKPNFSFALNDFHSGTILRTRKIKKKFQNNNFLFKKLLLLIHMNTN